MEEQQIRDLAAQGMSVRAIARKLGIDRKRIRQLLGPRPPSPSKLEPFKEKVRALASQGLTGPRILREIRAIGYTGSRTVLGDFLRTLREARKQPRKVFRRFETKAGVEGQADWSPYRVTIAGIEAIAHAFALVLGYSRRLYLAFFRNERLPTLMHAHVEAFGSFGGCTRTVLYDNMAQVTVGRVGGKPIWNPTFLEFAKHYGFEPRVCRPRDPNRKGKIERVFSWAYTELIVGNTFASWDELNARTRTWLETVANVRLHSTTHRRVQEMFAEEKPLLITLPSLPFPTDRREVRKVGTDGTVAVDGSQFPVPPRLVGQYVTVRVYPQRVEILDGAGQVVAAHAIPDRPTRLPTEWRPPAPPLLPRSAMETRFLARFPQAREFLEGLQRRMKSLTPIHLREIDRLLELYGEADVRAAIERAQAYGNTNALAVRRILEAAHPNVVPEPMAPLNPNPSALSALDDVEPASPTDYTIDTRPPDAP